MYGADSDGVSGFCVDGVCCNSACVGGCNDCDLSPATAGACTVVPQGSTGANPSCLPDTCDGVSASCPAGCTSDAQCVRPYTYGANGQCELRAAATCNDAQTLEASDGTLQSCAPYACENSGCVSVCHSVRDCAAGSVCDKHNVRVSPIEPDEASGCDLARGAHQSKVRERCDTLRARGVARPSPAPSREDRASRDMNVSSCSGGAVGSILSRRERTSFDATVGKRLLRVDARVDVQLYIAKSRRRSGRDRS